MGVSSPREEAVMEAVVAVAVLACPVGMGLMMWFMAKGMGAERRRPVASLEDLRSEHERLGREIEGLEDERSAPVEGAQ
jgi:hypothetical protein